MANLRVKGVIFDMDNTLLSSRIDFAAMKRDVLAYLLRCGALPDAFAPEGHTVSTMLEHARQAGMTDDMYESAMHIATRHEVAGMEGAVLEPGVPALLASLHGRCKLVVLTNNAERAAVRALQETGVAAYFDCIAGRERMTAMKPSPSGFLYVLDRYKSIAPKQWLTVGDSWIDGKAAELAGVPFVSYGGNHTDMLRRGITPVAHLERIADIVQMLET